MWNEDAQCRRESARKGANAHEGTKMVKVEVEWLTRNEIKGQTKKLRERI